MADNKAALIATLRAFFDEEGAKAIADWIESTNVELDGEYSNNLRLLQALRTGDSSGSPKPELFSAALKAYDRKFPYMRELVASGILPSYGTDSESMFVSYQREAQQLVASSGLSPRFAEDKTIRDYLVNSVSVDELKSRVQLAAEAVYRMPATTKQMFRDYYGVDEKDLQSFYLDTEYYSQNPNALAGSSAAALQKATAVASFGGIGATTGFALQREEAERLYAEGLTQEQAVTGLTRAGVWSSLAQGAGEQLSRDEILGTVLSSSADLLKADRVRSARRAQFSGSSGTRTTERGVESLG